MSVAAEAGEQRDLVPQEIRQNRILPMLISPSFSYPTLLMPPRVPPTSTVTAQWVSTVLITM